MDFLKEFLNTNNESDNPFSAFFEAESEAQAEVKTETQVFEEVIDKVVANEPEPEVKTVPKQEIISEPEATVEPETVIEDEPVQTIEEKFEKELNKELSENPELKADTETEESVEEAQQEEPVVEAVKEEEKPKKRGRRKKAAEASAEEVAKPTEKIVMAEEAAEEEKYEDVSGGKVASFDEAASLLGIESYAEFEAFREDVTEKLNNIFITKDINPTSIGIAVEAIDSLMVEVMEWYWRTKSVYDNFVNEKDGKLTVVRYLNRRGNNPDERARNGYLALKNYKSKDGVAIDLLATTYSLRYQYFFVANVLERLKIKKDLLVTMTAKLKMEQ